MSLKFSNHMKHKAQFSEFDGFSFNKIINYKVRVTDDANTSK